MKWPLVWRSTHEREVRAKEDWCRLCAKIAAENVLLQEKILRSHGSSNVEPGKKLLPRDPSGRFIKRGEG